MSRLPSIPTIEWKDGDIPYSATSNDVYYSISDGLSETRHVFIDGCSLPQAWINKNSFTIGELGFGTGLNFLAVWQLWNEHRPSKQSWLEFVSFENSLLSKEQATRALSRWAELNDLTKRLLLNWPNRAKGIRRFEWQDFGVGLTLHIEDIKSALPASQFKANAWFLDGFAPSRNPEMWTDEIYRCIAERSLPETSLATFSVAGHVRRGLASVGFNVSKKPGHDRKRQRLEAVFVETNLPKPDPFGIRWFEPSPTSVAILGAGIAGATLAWSLASYGCEVDVFDGSETTKLAASRNRFAFVMPRLDAGDNLEAKILIDAFLTARASYRGMPGVIETAVTQLPRSDLENTKFEKLLQDRPLSEDEFIRSSQSGLVHKNVLVLKPNILIDALLNRSSLKNKNPSRSQLESYDIVIIASGIASGHKFPWLSLTPKLGQVEYKDGCSLRPTSAVAASHIGLCLGRERFWGSTFEPLDGNESSCSAAKQLNFEGLKNMGVPWLSEVEDLISESRTSVRATTRDRLPLIGAIPDYDRFTSDFSTYANGHLPKIDAPLLEGWYMSTGFGSRGFTWGPWAASILTSLILKKPIPATEATLKAISPARQILRQIKRGELAI